MVLRERDEQPPIDRAGRPSEAHGHVKGLLLVFAAVLLLVLGGKAVHRVFVQDANRTLGEQDIVLAVTGNTVERPKAGAATQSTTAAPTLKLGGKADCPT
jgi:hypothetical protein